MKNAWQVWKHGVSLLWLPGLVRMCGRGHAPLPDVPLARTAPAGGMRAPQASIRSGAEAVNQEEYKTRRCPRFQSREGGGMCSARRKGAHLSTLPRHGPESGTQNRMTARLRETVESSGGSTFLTCADRRFTGHVRHGRTRGGRPADGGGRGRLV